MTDKINYEEFLEDLRLLTEKHGLVITGCGCCGSPAISPFSEWSPSGGHYKCNEDGEFVRWREE